MTAILNVKKSLICSLHTSHSDPDSDWNMPKSQKKTKNTTNHQNPKNTPQYPQRSYEETRGLGQHFIAQAPPPHAAVRRRDLDLRRAWAEVRSWWWWWWWLVYVGILCISNIFEIDVYFVMLLANLIWSDLTSTICLGQFGGLDDVLHSFLPPWILPFVSQQSPGLVALPVTAPEDGARKPGGDWQILADRLTMMEISFLSLKYVENDCFGSDSPTSSSDHQDYQNLHIRSLWIFTFQS